MIGMIALRCASLDALSEIASFGRTGSAPFVRFPARCPKWKASHAAAIIPAFRIEHNSQRRHHRFVVQQRLALPHQHHVRLRNEMCALIFERHEHLSHHFAGAKIAPQSQLRGQAEMAIHRATCLRGNANRLPALSGMKTAST